MGHAVVSAGITPSACFRALGLTFAVSASDVSLGRYLERILRPFTVEEEPAHLLSLLERREDGHSHFLLYFDDQHVATTSNPSDGVRELVRAVNREMMAATPECLHLHASAAERDGAAAIFPATMESGKSTLVTGLVQRGLGYVTDEVVAVDPGTLAIRPYPKPVSLDAGSWSVVPELRPEADESYLTTQWQVEPDAIRGGAVAAECRPGFIFFPGYDPAAVTELAPLTPAEAVMALAENTLNLRMHGPRAVEALARMAQTCPAYRLPLSDLDDACRLVLSVMAGELLVEGAGQRR